MFLDKEDHDLFKKLTENFSEINSNLIVKYFEDREETIMEGNNLAEYIRSKRNENKDILDSIYKIIRTKYYKIKKR